jgi:hypothetical protein
MQNLNQPDPADLPSTVRLLKSTGIAAAIASALLVTVVLPAEYGIDPTRIGSVFGLTEMGRIKRQLAAEAAEEEAASLAVAATTAGTPAPQASAGSVAEKATTVPDAPAPTSPAPGATVAQATPPAPAVAASTTDRTIVTLEPDEAAEVKLAMRGGARANFTWSTNGPEVNYDTHGDGSGVSYHGYNKGTAARQSGTITAAFDGHHGWFWRNRSRETVTITLQTSGDYESVDFVD